MHVEVVQHVSQSKDQISCNLNNEVAVLNLQSSQYFGLNEVGSFIWLKIGQGVTFDAICCAVVDAFGVEAPQARLDVQDFVEKLASEGLVQVTTSSF